MAVGESSDARASRSVGVARRAYRWARLPGALLLLTALALTGLGAQPARAETSLTATWVLTGGSVKPAWGGTADLIATPSGPRVLVAGGQVGDHPTADTWLYDAQTKHWTPGPAMNRARFAARSVLLDDGRVLVVGGDSRDSDNVATPNATYEFYEPVAGTWSDPLELPGRHDAASVTKLADGRVLIVGGTDYTDPDASATSDAVLLDPSDGSVTALPSLESGPRYNDSSLLLGDGRVLISGGRDPNGWPLRGLIYDPQLATFATTSGWPSVGGSGTLPYSSSVLSALPDGRVMAFSACNWSNARLYQPSSDTWSNGYLQATPYELENALHQDGTSDADFLSAAAAALVRPEAEPIDYWWFSEPGQLARGRGDSWDSCNVGVQLPDGDVLALRGSDTRLLTTHPAAVVTVTPDDQTMSSYDAVPDFTFTLSGLPQGVGLLEQPACTSDGVEGILEDIRQADGGEGPREITCRGGLAPEGYGLRYNTATLTIYTYKLDKAGPFAPGEEFHLDVRLPDTRTQTVAVGWHLAGTNVETGDSQVAPLGESTYRMTLHAPAAEGVYTLSATCTPIVYYSSGSSCGAAAAGEQFPITVAGGTDGDSVSADVENGAPNGGDGNLDGILDSAQSNVVSLRAAVTPEGSGTPAYVTLAASEGTSFTAVAAVDPGAIAVAPPSGVTLSTGLVTFALTGVATGADQVVSIFVESTAGVTGYAKYNPTTRVWALLSTDRVQVVDEHRVNIRLTDGGEGDADGSANGMIDDPGGLAFDTTPPTAEISGVSDGASYVLGEVPTAVCLAIDGESGPAGCAAVSTGGNANGTGRITYTGTPTDLAGNVGAPVTVHYTVTYRWDGFLQPINDPAAAPGTSRSVFKAGSVVPVKLQLKAADGTLVAPITAPVFTSVERLGSTTLSPNESVSEALPTTGSLFAAMDDHWQYNWRTKGLEAGYWYRINVRLDDTTTRSVVVGLK